MKNRSLNHSLAIFLAVFLMLAQIGFTVFASEDGEAATPDTTTTAATPSTTARGVITPFAVQPNVTFTAQGDIDLSNPTDLVFAADNASPLANYTFNGVQIKNADGRGYTLYVSDGITYSSGRMTIPAAAFVMHSTPGVGKGTPLPPGIYTAILLFDDGAGGQFEYSADFKVTSFSLINTINDALFTFNGKYVDLDKVFLNSILLDQYGILGRYAADLGGYGGFDENNPLGLVEEGSVKVTLYKSFLRTLAGGTYTLTVQFKDGTSGDLRFEVMAQPVSSSRKSGSNSSKASTITDNTWLERTEAERLAGIAKARRESDVRTFKSGKYGVRGDAWEKLAKVRYYHDTMDGTAVQARIYLDNPELFKKDTLVSCYIKGPDADNMRKNFEKWYSNKARAIHFDQQTDWKQPVEVAAKIDLDGMDTKNLYFYYYDKADNTYKRIENPGYRIDKNGYLHFTTPYAGDIIISDGPLKKK